LGLVLAALLRVAVPTHFVMLGSVYRLTEDAATLTHVPRAGLMPTLLYRLVFDLAPPSHHTVAAVNSVCALLTLPLVVTLLVRWQPPPWTAALLTGWATLVPALVTDARTESHLLPAMLWLWSGLLLLDVALVQARRRALAGAVLLLTMAAWSRPELTVMAPLLALATVWRRRQLQPGPLLSRPLVVAAAVGCTLLVPQLLHLQRAAAIEQASGALPALDSHLLLQAPGRWLTLALPLQLDLFPPGVTLLALLAVVGVGMTAQDRRWLSALGLAAALWMALTLVDLPRTSVPRLHAAAAWLVCILAAWAVAAAWQQHPPWRRWLVAALLVSVASGIPSARQLLARTNEDDNAAWIDSAYKALPAEGACLVALGMGDGPVGHRTQRALPDYLLRPPHRSATRYALQDWQRAGRPQCPGGTYLLVDQRCYALHRDFRDGPARAPTGLIEPCKSALAGATWRPLRTQWLANRGDNEYGYYGSVDGFAVGLYRLAPR
jgi:hypothetical protein